MAPDERAANAGPAAAALAMTDRVGIVSAYVCPRRGPAAGLGPDRRVARNAARLMLERARVWRPEDRRALRARVAELGRRVDEMLDSGAAPGVVLFGGVASGVWREHQLPVPVARSVSFDRRARVLPLVAALQDARPAGLAVLTLTRITLGELRGVALEEVESTDVTQAIDAWRRQRGRRDAGHPLARQPGPERDAFDRGLEAQVGWVVSSFAHRIAREARERGWDRLVVAGNGRLVAVLERCHPAAGPPLLELEGGIAAADGGRVATRAAEALDLERQSVRQRAAEAALEEALARGEDVRDAGWVAAALDAGRVARLHVDGAADAERLVRGALATSAAISVVDASPAWRERGVAGAIAELRW